MVMTANLVKVGTMLLVLLGLSNQVVGYAEATGAQVPDEF